MTRATIYTVLLFSLLAGSPALGQKISSIFTVIPADILDILSVNQRKDMIDFYQSGRSDKVGNTFGGDAFIKQMSDSLIEVQINGISSLQMRLLPSKDTVNVVGIIRTVCAPACDSQIDFYDVKNWKKLNRESFVTPVLTKHILLEDIKNGSDRYDEAISLIDMLPMKITFANNQLHYISTIEDYLPQEIYSQLKPFLRQTPLVKVWTGEAFE